MPTPAVNDVVDLIRRSGLVDDQKLAQVLSTIEEPKGDSGIICSSLINAGLLTQWQTEQLLSGKHRGFFLSKYKLLDKLGGGGMSKVYLGEHLEMGRRVAIKVLIGRLAERSEYLDRFRQEARAAARVDHPNIVRAFDVGQDGSTHFLVMEYIEGIDLEKLVQQQGQLEGRKAAEYIRQAAVGLAHVHKAGLIHRDIKPANMLVDRTDTIKLVDLGLARLPEETITAEAEDQVLGTVDYLAPEQSVDSHRVSPKVDIYSLGCTLYFLLSGRPPFPTGTLQQRVLKHRTQEPESLLDLRPDASITLVAICQKMMAKSPDDRFASADEVVEVLQNWLDGKSSRILSLSALRLKRPKGKSQHASGDDISDEELTLAPIDEEIKELAAKAAAEEKSESEAKSATEKSSDLESVSSEAAPWVPELLEELSTNEGIPTRVPMAHSTVVLGTVQNKKQGPPLGVLIAAGLGAAVVLALLIWVAISAMS